MPKDSKMSQRLAKYKLVYQKFDTNLDGQVDLEEVCVALGLTPEEAKKELADDDKNNDGKISFEEFYLLVKKEQKKIDKCQKKNDSKWKSAFKDFDKTGDGLISKDEFKQFWRAVEQDIPDISIELLFAAGDLDESGKISYEEFCAVLNFVNN